MSAPLTLERILTSSAAFGLTTASPLQRAICRIADGLPLGELAECDEVRAAVGDVASLPVGKRPAELYIVSGIRTGKSLLAAALAARASQTCDVSRLGPGEVPRVSVVSLRLDSAQVVLDHLLGRMQASPALRPLLMGYPTADAVTLRHPSGRPIEVKIVAGAKAGGTLVSRWSAGVIFDEAPRMNGLEDGVINLDDARAAVLGRLLPGAQIVYPGSPWAPFGPVYDAVQKYEGKPSANVVVIRAPGPAMNPSYWTPERCEELKARDESVYLTDVLADFRDPVTSLMSSAELDAARRELPLELPYSPDVLYFVAMDPATRGNAWTLVVVGIDIKESKRRIRVACTKQWKGSKITPLKPEETLAEIATICTTYGCKRAFTDQWSNDALASLARKEGIILEEMARQGVQRVEMYERLRTLIATRDIELSPDPELRMDLLSIQKRVTQAGITIDLPKTGDGRHADYAPALALAVEVAAPFLVPSVIPAGKAPGLVVGGGLDHASISGSMNQPIYGDGSQSVYGGGAGNSWFDQLCDRYAQKRN